MTRVLWESFAPDVLRALPELAPRYAQASKLWEDEPIPAHIVVGDILLPHLTAAVAELDASRIESSIDVLTSLANSNDSRLCELVMVSFIEFVLGDSTLEARLRPHLTPPLLELIRQRRNWKHG